MRKLATFVAMSGLSIFGTIATPGTSRAEEPVLIAARHHVTEYGPYHHLHEAEEKARYWELRGHYVEILGREHHWHVKVWFRG
jgi:hypothetical protein